MRLQATSHSPAMNSKAPIARLILSVISVGPVIREVPESTIAVQPSRLEEFFNLSLIFYKPLELLMTTEIIKSIFRKRLTLTDGDGVRGVDSNDALVDFPISFASDINPVEGVFNWLKSLIPR